MSAVGAIQGADRSRKRAKGSAAHVAKVQLRVTPRQAKVVDNFFHAGARTYNAVLREALRRCQALRADPAFEQAKAMGPGEERRAIFKKLEMAYGFTASSLQAYANVVRHHYPAAPIFAHEAQELSDQAFGAVARWHYAAGGKPRFKSMKRGLHSMSGKDKHSAIQPVVEDGHLVAVRWGKDVHLALARPKAGSSRRAGEQTAERERVAELVSKGALRYCRVVRSKVKGRYVYEAQFVLGVPAPLRHPVGQGKVSMDMGPSQVHWVAGTGPGHHDVLAPGVVYPHKRIRKLSRAIDRCHRNESQACFDSAGQHHKGRCFWENRSHQAENAQAALAEAHRVLAERRKTEHGQLLNKILAAGTDLRCEGQGYRSWQKSYSRSDRDHAPGEFIARANYKAESAGSQLYEFSTRTTALSQVCICERKEKKSLSLRWHSCECGAEADRDLFSAFLGLYVAPDQEGTDKLDFVGARRAFGPRRQDLACQPGAELAGLVPGKARVRRRPPPGERSLVRIARRLGGATRGPRPERALRQRPVLATTGGTEPAPRSGGSK